MNIALLIGLITFKPIYQLSWEIWYNINQTYVAEELCENKEKEELECNGKCYLKKQIEKAEPVKNSSENPEPIRPPHIKDAPFVVMSTPIDLQTNTVNERESNWENLPIAKSNSYHANIFHPPQALS